MIDNRILTQHVYESIKALIIDGEIAPGEKVNKKQLADSLGVSQTPVNDAMSRLAGEKYLEQINRRGFFVKKFSASDLQEMFEVRAGLEGIAIRLCVERAGEEELEMLAGVFADFKLPVGEDQLDDYLEADKKFHRAVIELSGSTMIREMTESFGYMMKSYQPGLVRLPDETLSEHQGIAGAVRDRDAVAAQELVIQHHMRTAKLLSR